MSTQVQHVHNKSEQMCVKEEKADNNECFDKYGRGIPSKGLIYVNILGYPAERIASFFFYE